MIIVADIFNVDFSAVILKNKLFKLLYYYQTQFIIVNPRQLNYYYQS